MIGAAVSAEQRRARWILILIAGIPLSMVLAATALWWAVDKRSVVVVLHIDARVDVGERPVEGEDRERELIA